jgi:hypothetical protein
MSQISSVLKEGKPGLKGELTNRVREIIGHTIDNLARQLTILDEPGKEKEISASRALVELKQIYEDYRSKEDRATDRFFASSISRPHKSLTSDGEGLSFGQNDLAKIQTVTSINGRCCP